jgi:hypothetical protein
MKVRADFFEPTFVQNDEILKDLKWLLKMFNIEELLTINIYKLTYLFWGGIKRTIAKLNELSYPSFFSRAKSRYLTFQIK